MESDFRCPTCGAQYKLVRVEANLADADREITCLKCGGPLNGREGRFILKYFLADEPCL
jgi:DNA-directed RNA polymerase subunit RPC12/RpoP